MDQIAHSQIAGEKNRQKTTNLWLFSIQQQDYVSSFSQLAMLNSWTMIFTCEAAAGVEMRWLHLLRPLLTTPGANMLKLFMGLQ